ncbi:MAG: glycosyltransferase family 9 protein [Flavobacteriales bacterium]
MTPSRIILSRTDGIGDVMLTLPMCGVLKQHFPNCEIIFLGRSYTRSIAACCKHIDHFENWDEWKDSSPASQIEALSKWKADAIVHVFPRTEILWLAKRARIPMRIATGRRWHTISKCNKLVFFTRKKSLLHESQLNLKLLKPLGIDVQPSLNEIPNYYGFDRLPDLSLQIASLIEPGKKNIILHPKSKGSAAEWGLKNFEALIALLAADACHVFITGSEDEGKQIKQELRLSNQQVTDLTGKLTLDELIAFIAACDALVAASTGPLHIAAALGKQAVGLYTPKRPMHPGRWSPVGRRAKVFTSEAHPSNGQFLSISPKMVADFLLSH